MRFKIKEHKDLQAIISESKWDLQDFQNTKKRGRLTVHHKSGSSFSFFRESRMILDENKQWQPTEQYEVGSKKSPEAIELSWKQVLERFKKWVDAIST